MFAMIIQNPRSLFHKMLIIAVLVTPRTIEGCAVNPTATPTPCAWTARNGATADSLTAVAGAAQPIGCGTAATVLTRTENTNNMCTLASGGTGTVTDFCVDQRGITVASSAGSVGPIATAAGETVMLTCTNGRLNVVTDNVAGPITQNSVTGVTITCG